MKFVDKDGKAYDYPPGMFGFGSPEQLRSQVIANEAEKLQIQAAKPAAISISVGASVTALVTGIGFELTGTLFLKGPKEGTVGVYVTPSKNASTPNATLSGGVEIQHLLGDERLLSEESLKGRSTAMSAGIGILGSYGVQASKSETLIDNGDKIEGLGLGVTLGKGFSVSPGYEKKNSFHMGSFKLYNNSNESYNTKESANYYYIRRYTNLSEMK